MSASLIQFSRSTHDSISAKVAGVIMREGLLPWDAVISVKRSVKSDCVSGAGDVLRATLI